MSTTAAAVLDEARSWIGTPYRHQGSHKHVGCDCLGLVRGIWRALYGREPASAGPYAPDWAETGGQDRLLDAARRFFIEKSVAEMMAGDLLVFRWRPHHAAKHLGIVETPGTFIHAYEGHAVMVSALIPHWRRRIAGVFSFPDFLPD